MELDDFKNTGVSREVGVGDQGMDELLSEFKSREVNKKKKTLQITGMLTMLFVVNAVFIVRSEAPTNIGYGLICTGFILGAIYIYWRYKALKESDYLLPTDIFLKKAEGRIKFMGLTDYLIVIPLLAILGTGGGILFVDRLSLYLGEAELLSVIWICFFVGLCVFAIIVSRKNWKREDGELAERISEMRKKL
ncbi:MAG: hypothetical protein AB9882_10880 [Ignavibacteriaceae bacterium]